ncbi:MAG: 4Fe-4S dicluster domain-containing protein [Pseudomonadota bacterium]
MFKFLTVNSDKCTGCRLCEQVCSVMHEGVSNPAKSRIQIVKWEEEGLYIPMICQQCEDAPCKNVCPVGAISRDKDFGFLSVNHDVCIGCRSCVNICPFGAMNYNMTARKVFKCDLCGGNPQCVRFCDEKAVDFITADVVSAKKKRESAARQSAAQRQNPCAGEHA